MCDGISRRHHRSPALARKPAGQESREGLWPFNVSQQLTLCFDQKASLFCSSLCEAVNQLQVSGVAMFAPPEAVGDYNAPTGGNYHFIASVLGCLKHVPRNPRTRGSAIVRFTHDARHSSGPLSYAPIHALLSAEVQSMMTHFHAFLQMRPTWHRPGQLTGALIAFRSSCGRSLLYRLRGGKNPLSGVR
jgi:hypothetical protein